MAKDYKKQADEIAKRKGGLCLSKDVLGVFAKTLWSCGNPDHPSWTAPFVSVRGGLKEGGKKGSWCPKCAKNSKVGEEEYFAYANKFGGKLVRKAKLVTEISDWWCAKCKKPFHRKFYNMKTTQTFCNNCSQGLSERLCKSALEQLFGVEFIKYRPKDLRGTKGNPLEIGDMYNADLKLAVEHHGVQHYKRKKNWGSHSLAKQQEHDRRRRAYCKKKGVTLIEIKQLTEDTKLDKFKDIIKSGCLKGGVPLPENFDDIEIKWGIEGLKNQQENQFKRLKNEAKKRKWKLITKSFLGVLAFHEFICEKGHRIKKRPSDLWSQNEGCGLCYKIRHLTPALISKGSEYQIFSSMSDAAKHLSISTSHVSGAAKRNGKTRGFRVVELTFEESEKLRSNPLLVKKKLASLPTDKMTVASLEKSKPVLTSDGRVFASITECANKLNVADASISRAAKQKKRCSKAGLGVYLISKKQELLFRENEQVKINFLNTKSSKSAFTRKKSKPVLRHDGRIYSTKAMAVAHVRKTLPSKQS